MIQQRMLYGAKTRQNARNEKQKAIVHRLLLLQDLNASSGGPKLRNPLIFSLTR
jgi:hypothetical protein